MAYTVGEVAKSAHLSVRTLHHYDQIGLLKPSARTDAGYRLYTDEDLRLLQQVLFFKELGFGLEEIRGIVTSPGYDQAEALVAQREWLAEKRLQTDAMIAAIDRALEALVEGVTMDKEDMFEVFGDFDPAEYEDEARERWGETDAYKESARRTKSYTKADWLRIKEEGTVAMELLTSAFDAGAPAGSEAANAAVQAWFDQIANNFYVPTMEVADGLADMYVADPRFTKNYDVHREGLAVYLRDAIHAWTAMKRRE
ncbi:MAG TPA: MerR family transcriptional regulator [Coriobacteriia bacterium]|nr:MerR family transcriptional regulator [Coriobacteriia bacterium]